MKIFKITMLIAFLIQYSCTKEHQEKTFSIGDTGPAGGIVFFDKGSFSEGWQYLEAAPQDHPEFCQSSIQFITISGTSEGLGKGRNNTELLNSLEQVSNSCYTQASNFEFGGFSDWYLPSKDELKQIRLQKNIIPNLSMTVGECKSYWCSSLEQLPSSNKWLAKCLNIGNGEFFFTDPSQRVRVIRQF